MRKIVFYLFLIAINYLFIELLSYGLYRFKFGDYTLSSIQHEKLTTIDRLLASPVYSAQRQDPKKSRVNSIIHPYVGTTVEGYRQQQPCDKQDINDCYIRQKVSSDLPMPKKSEDKLIVAFLGGSVSVGVSSLIKRNRNYLQLFNSIEGFENKKIQIVSLNAGGYKQPQHLMNLNYHYAMGAEFDLIINLDGFNEMAIPYFEYHHSKLHPSFPQSWKSYMKSTASSELLENLAKKQRLQKKAINTNKLALLPGIRWSPFCNLVWKVKNNRFSKQIGDLALALKKIDESKTTSYQATGPAFNPTDNHEIFDYSAKLWARSSILIDNIAKAQGTEYFHFVQPNQHIEGSKPLTTFELKRSYKPHAGYGRSYIKGFPYLQKEIPSLQQAGVNIIDLTLMLKDNHETLYIDNCCHFSSRGYELLFREMIKHIAEAHK